MADQPKFDFQNIDIKLYLAMKKFLDRYIGAVESGDWGSWNPEEEPEVIACRLAMQEFELSHGPLPEWACDRNWDYSLVPGAQLCTKDGRRTGNAHIIKHGAGIAAGPVFVPTFELITDAGSKFIMTEREIETAFYVGDWISDPVEVLKKFDHEGVFKLEPK